MQRQFTECVSRCMWYIPDSVDPSMDRELSCVSWLYMPLYHGSNQVLVTHTKHERYTPNYTYTHLLQKLHHLTWNDPTVRWIWSLEIFISPSGVVEPGEEQGNKSKIYRTVLIQNHGLNLPFGKMQYLQIHRYCIHISLPVSYVQIHIILVAW